MCVWVWVVGCVGDIGAICGVMVCAFAVPRRLHVHLDGVLEVAVELSAAFLGVVHPRRPCCTWCIYTTRSAGALRRHLHGYHHHLPSLVAIRLLHHPRTYYCRRSRRWYPRRSENDPHSRTTVVKADQKEVPRIQPKKKIEW